MSNRKKPNYLSVLFIGTLYGRASLGPWRSAAFGTALKITQTNSLAWRIASPRVTRASAIPQSSRSSTKSLEASAARESSDVGTRIESRREAVSKDFGGEKAIEIELAEAVYA